VLTQDEAFSHFPLEHPVTAEYLLERWRDDTRGGERMSALSDVLGGGIGGLKGYVGQTLTITGYDVAETDTGEEVSIFAKGEGDKPMQIRTTSGVVRKQLDAIGLAQLFPATVLVEERRSQSGRTYLTLSDAA
jgi:hypothetical protein